MLFFCWVISHYLDIYGDYFIRHDIMQNFHAESKAGSWLKWMKVCPQLKDLKKRG